MHPSDLRVRALELAVDSTESDFTTDALVSRAEAFAAFLGGKPRHEQSINIHVSASDHAELGRQIEKAIKAARRADGRS